MTEHLGKHKDQGLPPELSQIADRNSIEKPAGRPDLPEPGSRSSVTPPPTAPRSALVTSAVTSGPGTAAAVLRAPEEETAAALFASNEVNELRSRWDSIQVGFVDEPRKAVHEADALVSATMKRLTEIFTDERQNLERQWDRSENVSTEDLRVALQRYRSFFGRLLAI